MRVAVAADHGGFPLKDVVINTLKQMGHTPIDLGTDSTKSVDYPDFAELAGKAIVHGEADRAVALCGSGVGICIAGNKIKGVYACLCHDTYSAAQGVEHDHMNMLCLGARVIGDELAKKIVEAFITAEPSDEPRHLRRVEKTRLIEAKGMKGR
ncbi:MAG: RpiB/LacA/LacB family sugar-phosphate isomerase [Brevefilum sp.]|nr:RpiB/LacA/LacB family sugar-phosphate isomerase [Brevefilum sp.]MDT8380872.1 RpiB/LacA/LacB family sugar-phosphate isomerase [Brevefilum sp.]MDW7754870.1 RpiB/LacA/LacB family sugar-phosphate isomerase [Brevefilum sp.]